MNDKSIKKCIEDNDYNEVYKRFKKATDRWKDEWFMAFVIITHNCAEWEDRYAVDLAERTIKRKLRNVDDYIAISGECPSLLDDSEQKCYLFEFRNAEGGLVCSKVGTTTRKVKERLREELRSKTYMDMGAVTAVVHRVYDCGSYPAEGLESYFRAEYIKKYPNSFKKNDRFISIEFNLQEADDIYETYLGIEHND